IGSAVLGGDPRELFRRRAETRVLHAQRIEDALACKAVEWLPRCNVYHPDQCVECRRRAILPARARLKIERGRAQARDIVGVALAALSATFATSALLAGPP